MADLARQVKQRLESLQANGIEWLPKSAPLERRPAQPAAASLLAVETAAVPSDGSASAAAERRQKLDVLAAEVSVCTKCDELCSTRTQTVFGVGRIDPDICFIGEAPGADEDRLGEPFVGAAGQMLNRIIAGCGLTREEFYICNTIKCRPPGNRSPKPEEAANCRPFLDRQLELVRPKSICCLGGTAALNLLGINSPLGKLRGRFHDYKGIPVLCTYHPAYLLPHRQPEKKKEVWEDMKMLLTRLGRPISPVKQK